MNAQKTPIKKFNMWLLLTISVLPVIIAWVFYHYHAFFAFKTVNHGVLITPPIHSTVFSSVGVQQHQWQIIYMPGTQCDKKCTQVAFTLQQLKTALGKESPRVNVHVVTATAHEYAPLQQVLLQTGEGFNVAHKIYLMDPADNLFMYYPDDSNLLNILKDLKRVLEVSQIG